MFRVLIACYANWDTPSEIPYLLKKSGCNVDIYCSNKSWLLSNSFHDRCIPSSPEKEKYLEELIILVKKEQYDWIILESDVLIKYLNAFIEEDEDTECTSFKKQSDSNTQFCISQKAFQKAFQTSR
jgi:hypothetical protein